MIARRHGHRDDAVGLIGGEDHADAWFAIKRVARQCQGRFDEGFEVAVRLAVRAREHRAGLRAVDNEISFAAVFFEGAAQKIVHRARVAELRDGFEARLVDDAAEAGD